MPQVKQQFKENKFNIRLNGIPANIPRAIHLRCSIRKLNMIIRKNKRWHKSNDVLQYFIQQNINIEAFNEILPSLNDIFIHL